MNNGFPVFTGYCLSGIVANEDRLKGYVEKSVGIFTEVNPHIGYEIAAHIAKEASKMENPFVNFALTEQEPDLILNPFEMT